MGTNDALPLNPASQYIRKLRQSEAILSSNGVVKFDYQNDSSHCERL
jgi:hypothetical protein